MAACTAPQITPLGQVDTQGVKYIEANGLRFAYLEQGQGPLVLIFHGYPDTPHSWQDVQQRLAKAGYRVIMPWMRGYPPSSPSNEDDYRLPTLGRDVLSLIDAFGAEQAVVVGHDWGAVAVMNAAASDPSKLDAMVTLCIPHLRVAFSWSLPGLLMDAPHFVYYQSPWSERRVSADNFAHIDQLLAQWSAPGYEPAPHIAEDIKITLSQPGATQNALQYYKSLLGWTNLKTVVGSRSDRISTPSLVIAGREDNAVDLDIYEKARHAFVGDYQFVALDGVGHFPQLEAPEQTAETILKFLEQAAP